MASAPKGTKRVKANPFAGSATQDRYKTGRFYKAPSGSMLVATGTENQLKKRPDFIYSVGFMVAGTRDDIEALLRKYGYSGDQIARELNNPNNTFGATNVNVGVLNMLKANYKSFKSSQPEEVVDLTQLDRWRAAEESKKARAKREGVAKKSPRGDLRARFNQRKKPYLSVSKLTEKGTGSKLVDKPTAKEAESKTHLPGLVSNNEASYVIALQLIGVDSTLTQNALNEFRNNLAAIATGRTATAAPVVAAPAPALVQIPVLAAPTVAAPALAAPVQVAPMAVPALAAPVQVAPMAVPTQPARLSPVAGTVMVAAPGVQVRTPTRVSGGFPTIQPPVMVGQASPRAGNIRL